MLLVESHLLDVLETNTAVGMLLWRRKNVFLYIDNMILYHIFWYLETYDVIMNFRILDALYGSGESPLLDYSWFLSTHSFKLDLEFKL